jgi:hypothetical protein
MKLHEGIFLFIGIGFLITSVLIAGHTDAFLKKSTIAMGEIVGFVTRENAAEDGEMTMPVIKFKDTTGVVFQFQSCTSTSKDYFKGQHVIVRYLANDPNKARMANSFIDIWLTAIAPLVFGFSFTSITLVCIIFRRKKAQSTVESGANEYLTKKIEEQMR